ncbi:MAG: hypothetical protein JKY55_05015 [Aliivibrio sp.]|uniref:hypothetical protein n=1 Tax=Aliivibrio sp. TaxID=1872443 RepID=UPI001A4CAC52|nr:hypothetical protein [Aliivibrio sp.]
MIDDLDPEPYRQERGMGHHDNSKGCHRMAKRKEKLTEPNLGRLLEEAKLFRSHLHSYQDGLAPFKDDYNALSKVRKALDGMAEELTGDPEYYHAKAHKA